MSEAVLGMVVERLGGELIGNPATPIDRISTLDTATPSSIAFLANPRYEAQLGGSRAACVIVGPALRQAAMARGAAIVTADPYAYFARLTQWWAARTRAAAPAGIHASAVVDGSAVVAADASIGACAVVSAGAHIASGVVIGAHTVIEAGATVGAGSRLAPRVTLGAGCSVGARCILHSGVVVGADGFGFAPVEGRWEKIEQLGAVRIGDDVEIGANTCIDRGALDDTVIGDGVKLDNLVQIGHNVRIGAHSVIAGCTGIAGSTVLGTHCVIGGGVGIAGHLRIADHVTISGATSITRSIAQPGRYSGVYPFEENASWEKNAAALRRLHALRTRVQMLEKKRIPEANTP